MFRYLLSFFLVCILFSCKGEKKQLDISELKATATFIQGQVAVDGNLVRVGDQISSATVVKVGIPGTLVLQIHDIAAVTLRAGTEISIQQMLAESGSDPQVIIAQAKGETFSKVIRKGSNYQIRTPSVTAGVRGTSFNLTVDEKNKSKTTVRLLKGKLSLTKPKTEKEPEPEEIELNTGEKAILEVDKPEEKVEMSADEMEILEVADEVEILPAETLEEPEKIEEKEVITKAAIEVTEQTIEAVAEPVIKDEVKKPVKRKAVTLDSLRKKYGSVVKITTKDGKVFVGAFEQKASSHIIYTVNGEVKIKSDTIAKIVPMR